MELQWELIVFTTLVAWSAGLFASQCVLAIKGDALRAQIPAWICAAGLLVVGGIAVFFHLEHWDRIFNGFGHLTSGITQEFIALIVLAVVAVVYLVYLRKREGEVPAWIAVVGIVAAAALVFVMGHSYMMPARPAWDNVLQILSLFGAALGMGSATMAVFVAKFADVESKSVINSSKLASTLVVVGSVINAVATVSFVALMSMVGGSFSSVGRLFDATHPANSAVDVAALSPFCEGSFAITILALAAAVLAVVFALLGRKQGSWIVWGSAVSIAVCASAVALRVVFYQMGMSVFMFF